MEKPNNSLQKRTLHVVSNIFARSSLICGFCEMNLHEEVTCLPINLSFGYLPKDFSDKELCMALASHTSYESFRTYSKRLGKLKQFFSTDYSVYDKIIVWHGNSASDLLLLYLMSAIVKEKLYHIDIKECVGFMNSHRRFTPIDMKNVRPKDIAQYNMLSLVEPLDEEKLQYCRKQWHRWKKNKSLFRFYDAETGDIKAYSDDFMDNCILETAKKHPDSGPFAFVAYVMANCQERFSVSVSDTAIKKRIHHLILGHKLEVSILAK